MIVSSHLHFEEPHEGLADSYRSLIKEFLDRAEDLIPFPLRFPNDDFPVFLAHLSACSRGENLPDGFVPHTTYWLVRGGVEVVGVANLRHALTENLCREGGHIGYGVRPSARGQGFATALLRHTLEQARAMGIDEALLTCSKSNEPSARTILRSGGVLDSEELLVPEGELIQRYYIPTAKPGPRS